MTPTEIKNARFALGLNMDQMASALGVDRNTWGKWERGERHPGAAAVTAINLLLHLHERGLLAGWLDRHADFA